METKVTINDLFERIDWLIWGKGVERFIVTETFNYHETMSFLISGLNVDIEGDFVMFSDVEDRLFSNNSRLCLFNESNILSIDYGRNYIDISFKTGNVKITECYF